MSTFRGKKVMVRQWLQAPDWNAARPLPPQLDSEAASRSDDLALASVLIACLPLGQPQGERAACALGTVMARMQERDPEEARNIVRRLMWHMNEESGNIGWGVPEAMAWVLVCSAPLAERYHRILFSYILPLEVDSNYCDHALLRRSCFRAAEIFLAARPEYAAAARAALEAGLKDEDPACRAKAQELWLAYGSGKISS